MYDMLYIAYRVVGLCMLLILIAVCVFAGFAIKKPIIMAGYYIVISVILLIVLSILLEWV